MSYTTALEGVQVVELAAYIPGPVCTQILASLGASVIKVERPGGDPMRRLMCESNTGISPLFEPLNAGKRCVELDLRAPAGAAAMRELVETADVLVDGMRPGALARLQLDPATLQAANPRLIYCAISSYGATGAGAPLAGHDLNALALAGLLDLTRAGSAPALPGSQLADMVSGLGAATAILAALRERERSGAGAHIDMSLLGAARWLMAPWLAAARAGVALSAEAGYPFGGSLACYHIYRTADGRGLAVAALEPHFWERFCTTIGAPELSAGHSDTVAQPALIAAVSAIIAGQPLAHWQAVFATVDACVTPLLTPAEASAAIDNWADDIGAQLFLPATLRS